MSKVVIYGISPKSCDTVRKALKWLSSQRVEVNFHDFREDGLTRAQLDAWVALDGWEQLLNKRSTSFRNLSEDQKTDLDSQKAIELMLAHPTLIKRPVLASEDRVLVGFNEASYREWFCL